MSESSQFQNYKCTFGKQRFTDFIIFCHATSSFKLFQYEILLRFPPYSADNICSTEMEKLLEEQINGIIELIKKQADQVKGRTIVSSRQASLHGEW